jgi:integrase
LSNYLSYLETFYAYTDRILGDGRLDDALASIDVESIGRAVEGYFMSLRNHATITAVSEARWQIATQFVNDILTRLAKNRAPHASLDELQRRLSRLDLLYSQLRVGRRRKSESIRSLPGVVVEALYDQLDPGSPSNPFTSEATRWRVWILFVLLLHQGLRRGEVLSLSVDAVKSGFDATLQRERYWLGVKYNEYQEDTRFSKPSIKTADSFRQIPVSEPIALLVDSYITSYRGRLDHSFLLGSQQKRPLSTEGVTKGFQKISRCLPEKVLKALYEHSGKHTISPHDLRHTCAVLRLNQLLAANTHKDEALHHMRAFFGWSRSSDMPLRYSRAVLDDRLAAVWRSDFDDRVGVLRSLRGSF